VGLPIIALSRLVLKAGAPPAPSAARAAQSPSPAAAPAAQQASATVKSVEGTVETRPAIGQPWVPVKVGDTLALPPVTTPGPGESR
jgi:hypothetical protein